MASRFAARGKSNGNGLGICGQVRFVGATLLLGCLCMAWGGPVDAVHSTVSADPSFMIADGVATSTITVTLKDAAGNAVSGKTVALAQGSGHSTLSAASGASDANGVVTFTAKDTIAEA